MSFIESRASWQLTMTTIIIMASAAYLPYSPLADFDWVCSATGTFIARFCFLTLSLLSQP